MNKLESRLANQSDSDSLIANEACNMNFTLLKVTGMVSRITVCPMKWVTPVSKLVNFWHLKSIYGTHFLMRYLQLISLYHTIKLITSFHFMKRKLSCCPSVAFFKVRQYRLIDSVG